MSERRAEDFWRRVAGDPIPSTWIVTGACGHEALTLNPAHGGVFLCAQHEMVPWRSSVAGARPSAYRIPLECGHETETRDATHEDYPCVACYEGAQAEALDVQPPSPVRLSVPPDANWTRISVRFASTHADDIGWMAESWIVEATYSSRGPEHADLPDPVYVSSVTVQQEVRTRTSLDSFPFDHVLHERHVSDLIGAALARHGGNLRALAGETFTL